MQTIEKYLNREPPDVLYHYTSMDGLQGILRERSLWATHALFLNDAEEVTLAVNLARRSIEVRRAAASAADQASLAHMEGQLGRLIEHSAFVTSFSASADLLSQWRGYCPPGRGYCIGISSAALRAAGRTHNLELFPCVYSPEDQAAIVNEVIEECLQAFPAPVPGDSGDSRAYLFVMKFLPILPILKNRNFSEEDEWRVVSGPINPAQPSVQVRSGASCLLPFFPWSISENGNSLSVAEIIVGPTHHPELAISGVEHLLASTNTSSLVRRSSIPYRSW